MTMRCSFAGAALLLAFLAVASPVSAQNKPAFFVGGGLTLPTGDYGDYAKTGWMAAGGATLDIGPTRRFWAGLEGVYGSNSHEGDAGDKTNLYGANGLFGISGNPGSVNPYAYGSAGLLVHHYSPGDTGDESSSESAFAWSGAAGVSIPAGSMSVWIEARYYSRDGTNFIPLMVGLNFGGN